MRYQESNSDERQADLAERFATQADELDIDEMLADESRDEVQS